MCIIVCKPKGVDLPSKEILENCFDNNPDGAGIMYTENGKVVILKGFMNFKSFLYYLDMLDGTRDIINISMVLHFRIGTQGGNTPENTHPFPVSKNERTLKKLDHVTTMGIAHNGTIKNCVDPKSKISDTMIFIRDYLSYIYKLDKKFYKNKKIMATIQKFIGSKLAILTKDDEIITIGEFTKVQGILYSNHTFNFNWKQYTKHG